MIATLVALLMSGAPHVQTVAEMRYSRRVVIVAAPSAQDPKRQAQERALHEARAKLAERDVTIVELTGAQIAGAGDDPGTLRRRLHLPDGKFAVVLIGKDGREAMRRASPIDATTLIATIDAMPMRRAGLR